MSEERKPLLSDAAMYIGVPMDQARPDGICVPGITRFPRLSAGKVRDFYENLITTGKLRVVEECGYVPPDTWCSVCICKGCGEACSEVGEKDPYPHCPYCTRKIKR